MNKWKTMAIGCAALAASAAGALAFPTWMGVYGGTERHGAGNPGTFTVMMNQDYWGLNAEVGVRVDAPAGGGKRSSRWQVYPMAYAGNRDGNSVWTWTPSEAFPEGAVVTFYFHGWEDRTDRHIWDSNGGQDYTFTAEGPVVFKGDWGAELHIPHTAGAYAFDIAAADGTLYAAWQEGGYWADGGYRPPQVRFSRKEAGRSWEMPRTLAEGSYPVIAASSAGVFVLYTSQEWPQTATLIRSTDGGGTWNTAAEDSFQTRYARLRAGADDVFVAYDEFTAPETSRIYFRRMAAGADSWEPAVLVFDKSSYKATVSVKDLAVAGSTVALSTVLQGWYGGYSTAYFHESLDGGATWTERGHGLGNVQTALDAAGRATVLGYRSAPTGGGLYVAGKAPGADWDEPRLLEEGSAMAAGLQAIGSTLVALTGPYDAAPVCRTSPDGGRTWSEPAPAGVKGGSAGADVSDGADMHVFYYTASTLSTGAHGAGDPMQWAGNVTAWPDAGEIGAGDPVWINAETWPAGTASEMVLVCSVDGGDWRSEAMGIGGLRGNNDWWHLDIGTHPAGTVIQYAIMVIDARGDVTWLNNGGGDYVVQINP